MVTSLLFCRNKTVNAFNLKRPTKYSIPSISFDRWIGAIPRYLWSHCAVKYSKTAAIYSLNDYKIL